jgi:hypothetical protein
MLFDRSADGSVTTTSVASGRQRSDKDRGLSTNTGGTTGIPCDKATKDSSTSVASAKVETASEMAAAQRSNLASSLDTSDLNPHTTELLDKSTNDGDGSGEMPADATTPRKQRQPCGGAPFEAATEPAAATVSPRAKDAADPAFLGEFFQNSRLHHISTMGANAKVKKNTAFF